MKVFIGSPIGGLEPFRDAAGRAAGALRHEVKRSEDFGASADTPQQACLAGVRWADVVVLLLGARYGDPQPSGLSATHEFWRRDDLPRTRASWRKFYRSKEVVFSVAANMCEHPDYDGDFGSIVGSNRTRDLAGDPPTGGIDTGLDYMKSAFGGYGLYYRSPMVALGLVYPAPENGQPVDLPTERGQELAEAFRERIAKTEYRKRHFRAERVPRRSSNQSFHSDSTVSPPSFVSAVVSGWSWKGCLACRYDVDGLEQVVQVGPFANEPPGARPPRRIENRGISFARMDDHTDVGPQCGDLSRSLKPIYSRHPQIEDCYVRACSLSHRHCLESRGCERHDLEPVSQ